MKSKLLQAIQEGIKQSFMLDPNIEDEDFVKSKISKIDDFEPYKYKTVDLGLSVDWCEYNLGAYPGSSHNNWYGDYYAWAETKPKQAYNWDTYKYCKDSAWSLTKYNSNEKMGDVDNLTHLEPIDDVINITLGNRYRMPTHADFKELCNTNKVSNKWVVDYNGVKGLRGRLFISKVPGFEGNSLFIPAASYMSNRNLSKFEPSFRLWTSDLYPYNTDRACDFLSEFYHVLPDNNSIRYIGCPVRGVREK